MTQYRWYFPSTTITLLNRDVTRNWVMIGFERPVKRIEVGPGICATPPTDFPQ